MTNILQDKSVSTNAQDSPAKWTRTTMPWLNRAQKSKIRALLNMEYSPAELANEIGCHRDPIYRRFIPAGCPHHRDSRNHILINGVALARWYQENRPSAVHLATGEAWCCRCNAPVTMQPPFSVKPTNRYLELVSGTCPICGATVNRARARRKE